MQFEVQRSIPADHPSLPGHFPGDPIVPGVVILDEIFAALREWRANHGVDAIRTVKFLSPLRPEQSFTILLSENAHGEIDFRCRVEDREIVEGRLQISARAS